MEEPVLKIILEIGLISLFMLAILTFAILVNGG
jgi:hypothetical protein